MGLLAFRNAPTLKPPQPNVGMTAKQTTDYRLQWIETPINMLYSLLQVCSADSTKTY